MMERQKAMRMLWATANDTWGKELADFFLHCALIVLCLKESFKEATVKDISIVLSYVKRIQNDKG